MVVKSNMNKKNMIWRKEKLEEIYFSKNVVSRGHAHASGSGDGSSFRGFTCCRLCGGDRSLRGIKETCLWEGVEERYDHVLFDCFGVKVSPEDSKICASCINQLMITHKFRALVQAAFTKTCSNGTSYTSGENRIDSSPDDVIENYSGLKIQDNPNQLINKKILDILSQNITHPQKRALKRNTAKISNPPRKIIASCAVCGQRYPLMIIGDMKEFICSRCKLKRNTIDVKKLNLVSRKEENFKADCRVKGRLSQLKKPAQIKNIDGNNPKSFLKRIKAANTVQPNMKPQFLLKSNKKI